MKVKVIKRFKDRYTKTLHKTDQELEMTAERFEEINSTSLGVFVEEIVKEEVEKEEVNEEKETEKVKEETKKTTKKKSTKK